MSAEIPQPILYGIDYEEATERLGSMSMQKIWENGSAMSERVSQKAIHKIATIVTPPSTIPGEQPKHEQGVAFLAGYYFGLGAVPLEGKDIPDYREQLRRFAHAYYGNLTSDMDYQKQNYLEVDEDKLKASSANYILDSASAGLSADHRREPLIDNRIDDYLKVVVESGNLKKADISLHSMTKDGLGFALHLFDSMAEARHFADLITMEDELERLDINFVLNQILESAE